MTQTILTLWCIKTFLFTRNKASKSKHVQNFKVLMHHKVKMVVITLYVFELCLKVTHLPKEDYGKFFGGDSYIILNTYKDKESDEVQ